MNQALYAHMNNKRKMKKKNKQSYDQWLGIWEKNVKLDLYLSLNTMFQMD
jgi:hypothetical protein